MKTLLTITFAFAAIALAAAACEEVVGLLLLQLVIDESLKLIP